MADYFLVEQAKGPAWDHTRGRREQEGWDEDAAFMDRLAEDPWSEELLTIASIRSWSIWLGR